MDSLGIIPLLIFTLSLVNCTDQRMDECEWYLVPFKEARDIVAPGYVSVCVANFKTNKQQCYFEAPLKFAEKLNMVPFRYTDLKYKKGIPKRIQSVKTCKKGK